MSSPTIGACRPSYWRALTLADVYAAHEELVGWSKGASAAMSRAASLRMENEHQEVLRELIAAQFLLVDAVQDKLDAAYYLSRENVALRSEVERLRALQAPPGVGDSTAGAVDSSLERLQASLRRPAKSRRTQDIAVHGLRLV